MPKGLSRSDIAILISLIATIVTFLTWTTSIDQFNKQLQLQRESEYNEHLGNIKSLELELNTDIKIMKNFLNQSDVYIENKTIHSQLILENLKISVADGKMSNKVNKNHLINALFYGGELNQRILYVNSPEFIALQIMNVTKASTDIKHFRRQTVENIENFYLLQFQKALESIIWYRGCLEDKMGIEKCS